MAGIDIKVKVSRAGGKFLNRALERMNDVANVKMMLQIGAHFSGEIAKQVAAFTSQSKGRKTGALMRSWRTGLKKRPKSHTIKVFSDLPYAGKLQVGGRILPKSAKNLAIPVTESVGALGPRDLDVKFSWPIFMKTGTKMLVDASTGKPLFVLKPFVDLKGPYIGYLDRAAEEGSEKVNTLFWEKLTAEVKKAARETSDKGK